MDWRRAIHGRREVARLRVIEAAALLAIPPEFWRHGGDAEGLRRKGL